MSRLPVFLAFTLAACGYEETVTEHLLEGRVERVWLDAGATDVDLVGVDGLQGARVVERTRWQGERPEVTAEIVGGELHLTTDCAIRLAIGTGCSVDLTVEVPTDAALEGSLTSGDVSLDGIRGGVALTMTSGNLELIDLAGDVRVEGGSGNVSGRDLAVGALDVEIGSGDVDVELIAEPSSARLDARSGNLALALPAGAYDLRAETSTGEVEVRGVEADPEAPVRVELGTRSGDIAVIGR